jgi:hypothetical protein
MADTLLQPVIEALGEEFPLEGTPHDQLRAAVKYAIRAPSSHNSQPWVFRLCDGSVELYADRSRRLPVVDPEDRELVISCGAALYHLRLALHYFGLGEETDILPDSGNPDLLARVRLQGTWTPTEEERALFSKIAQRHTDRSTFLDRAVPEATLSALSAAAQREGAWLHVLDDPTIRECVADLIGVGDRIQMTEPAFRRELASWLRPNRTHRGDGMPGWAVGSGHLTAAMAPLVIRTFAVGRGQGAKGEELARGSPVLAVLGTVGEHPAAWIAAGQALGHVLLRAQLEGLGASFLNQPIEVGRLRRLLEVLIGRVGHAQLILRLGYSTGTLQRSTPRRTLKAVIR